jgi:hypothetical protein
LTSGCKLPQAKLPEESAKLIVDSAKAKKSERMLREHIAEAKQSSTRQRRASRALGIEPS